MAVAHLACRPSPRVSFAYNGTEQEGWRLHVDTCVCTSRRISTCHVFFYICIRIYIYTYTQAYIHTYIHTYRHTCTHNVCMDSDVTAYLAGEYKTRFRRTRSDLV